MEIQEFQYPDGWYMRVGQVYSSPYESYHARITRIDQLNEEEQVIFYVELNPRNYSEIWSDEEEHAYAWWFNQGHWDLEKEPDNWKMDTSPMTLPEIDRPDDDEFWS